MVKDREQAVKDNLGLVHSIAKRFLNRGADYDDIYQAGCLGLIKAVDNFDESRGFAFSTYAVPVIMGEIKRIFREGEAIRVSRALKEKSIYIQSLRDCFVKKELREPTVNELSKLSGYDIEELSEILNILSPVVSLSSGDDEENSELDIPIDESDMLFDRLCINQLLSKLNEKEKQLIRLRYFEGKTQCETAEILGISQVQVSRKEKATLQKLKQLL